MMIGRSSWILFCLLVTRRFEGTIGFQSKPRSCSVISISRLSVTTTSNSVSTNSDSTDESSASPLRSPVNEVDFKAYGNGYRTVFSEMPFADCEALSGSIPSDLRGSYFRAGPGKKQMIEDIQNPSIRFNFSHLLSTYRYFIY